MLQKIRITKANKQLEIVEKPAGKFTGQIDETAAKRAGETQADFANRRIEQDMKRLHDDLDALDAKKDAASAAIRDKVAELNKVCDAKAAERDAHSDKILNTEGGRKPTKQEMDENARLNNDLKKSLEERKKLWDEQDLLESRHSAAIHDTIGEFVKAHSGGLVKVDADSTFSFFDNIKSSTSKYAEQFLKNGRSAWSFFNKTLSPIHQSKAQRVSLFFDTKGGSADYSDFGDRGVARHGTLGGNGDYHTSKRVIVHEVAHGLHYGDPTNPQSMAARAAVKEDYDARVAKLRSENQQGLESVAYHPERQSYKMLKPIGEKRKPYDESYLGYANQYADSENGNPTGATEVISVGVEHVYAVPREFRKKHRSHFDLTVLFMAGRLH